MAKKRVGVLLRESIGGNKSTNKSQDLATLTQRYVEFTKKIRAIVDALKAQHASMIQMEASRLQVAHQLAAMAKETPLFDAVGLMPSADRPSHTVCSYTSVHDELAAKGKSYAQKYQQFVLEYAIEWEKIIRTRIDNGIKKAEELRIELDHYQKKTEALRLSANQSMVKGKSIPSSVQEKLTRNEEKLIASKGSYNQVATDLCILMEEVTERSWRDLHPLIVKIAQFDMTVSNDDAKSLAPLSQVVDKLKQVAADNGLSAQPRLKDLAALKPELLSTRPGGVAGLAIEAGPVFGSSTNSSFEAMALPPGAVAPQGMGGFPVQIQSLSSTSIDPFAPAASTTTTNGYRNSSDPTMPSLSTLSIQPASPPTLDDIYGAGPSSTRSAPSSGNFNGYPALGPSTTPTNIGGASSQQWNARSSSFNDIDSASVYSGYSMPSMSGPPPPPSMPPPPPPSMPPPQPPMMSTNYGAPPPSSYNSMVPLTNSNNNSRSSSPWAAQAAAPPPPMNPMSYYGNAPPPQPPRYQAPPPPPHAQPNYNPFGN